LTGGSTEKKINEIKNTKQGEMHHLFFGKKIGTVEVVEQKNTIRKFCNYNILEKKISDELTLINKEKTHV